MGGSKPKRRTTHSRRYFLKGVGGGAIDGGGGTTTMTAKARGFQADEGLEARSSKAMTLAVNGQSISVQVDPAKVIGSRAVLTLVALLMKGVTSSSGFRAERMENVMIIEHRW